MFVGSTPFQGIYNYFYGINPVSNIAECKLTTDDDIKFFSIKAFFRYADVCDFKDFWKRANTCDACLVLLEPFLEQKFCDKEVEGMFVTIQKILEKNLFFYNESDLKKMWIDDFGWWGLMGLNAFKLMEKIGNYELSQKYLNLSKDCFKRMIDFGVDINKNDKPVPFGCRNTTQIEPNCGVKNTVVNALLMLLSTKLYRLHVERDFNGSDDYLKMAYEQWIFFSKWFEHKDDKYMYFKSFIGDDSAALVGERPLDFSDGSSYRETGHPDWSPGWVWSGDNGLLIGAFGDLISYKDNLAKYAFQYQPKWRFNARDFEAKITNFTKKLIQGVHKGMIGNDGIFHELACVASYNLNGNDYLAGRGILLRYMDLEVVKKLTGIDFKDNILKTVFALWSTRDESNNQFREDFTPTQANLDFANQCGALLGISDRATCWILSHEKQNEVEAITQALGIDFLAAAAKFKSC